MAVIMSSNRHPAKTPLAKTVSVTSWTHVRTLPPSAINDIIRFEPKHSDAISRFLLLCGIIQGSSWYQSEQIAVFRGKGKSLASGAPDMEKTMFVLIYFKQLIGGDELFNHVCNYYMKFIDSDEKSDYVKLHRKQVADILKRQPDHPTVWETVSSNQQFLHAFMAGAMISHSRNKEEELALTVAFKQIFRQENAWEGVTTVLNYLLLNLYSHIAGVAALIALDYEHWLKKKMIPLPDLSWRENMLSWQDGE